MNLGDRMKGYEGVSKTKLMRRSPAIIRIDGKAFHTWTKGLESPFDPKFYAAMAATTQQLVADIQGATIAYGQSDEISILLKDYTTYETEAWFGGAVQKITSVAASMATAYFNQNTAKIGIAAGRKPALFDARVFVLPHHEVTNYFIWRQQDFLRNSVQACGQHYLGHKACHGLNRQDVVDTMREMEEPFDWYNDLDRVYQHGYTCQRGVDVANFNIPLFSECREFIDVHI